MKKIMTLHPEGKNGVNIAIEKYEILKKFVLDTLSEQQPMTYQDLNQLAIDRLQATFDGNVGWYLVSVKLDLEARGIIERIPKTSPHALRLVDQ